MTASFCRRAFATRNLVLATLSLCLLPTPAMALESAAPPQAGAQGGGGNAQGEALYKSEDYEAAAVQFYKVADGTIPGDVGRAQFWLGKTLFKLGFYSAALSVFDEIVQAGTSHAFHKLTLPWLASIARELPEGAEVLAKIGTYSPADLEDEAFDEVRDELYYLLGRFYYNKADFPQAIALLNQVPENSDYYIPAQYFLGMAYTRDYKGSPAVTAFKNVLNRSQELREVADKNARAQRKAARKAARKRRKRFGKKKELTSIELSFQEEMRQYEHLARLGLANIFYMVGKFDTAIGHVGEIGLDSAYYLEGVLVAALSEIRKVEVDDENANRHYQRTLGYVHTLNAPFFEEYLFPDALKLKAVTYYFNCRYDSAQRTVDEFKRRYPETQTKLQAILEQAPEDFKLYDLARNILREESGLDPFTEQVAQKALLDKQLANYFKYVDELEREQQLLAELSGDFRGSGVGERVTVDLDLALSAARERAGAESRKRLNEQIDEIKSLTREMIKVEFEIDEKRKAQKELEKTPPKPQRPDIDSEHEIYNYNGEYWQDELGYYRYKVSSLCKD